MARNYVGTAFNVALFEGLKELQKTDPDVRLIAAQIEICPDTSREHVQFYIAFNKTKRIDAVKRLLGYPAHLEVRRGSETQAIEYCTKNETRKPGCEPVIQGRKAMQGERNDIRSLQEALDSGASYSEVCESHFPLMARYSRFAREYIGLKQKPRDFLTELHILWGAPGCGKTRFVAEHAPGAYYLRKGPTGVWWDAYAAEEDVVIDDFYGWIPYDLLLRLAGREPLQVDIKGGAVNFVAKRIWITSNKHWSDWYNYQKCCKGALQRRITTCTMLDSLADGDALRAAGVPGLESTIDSFPSRLPGYNADGTPRAGAITCD